MDSTISNDEELIINELSKVPTLLKFISKNLSWGIYSKTVLKIYEEREVI